MDATQALERLGGTASTKQLLRLTTRRRLRRAVRQGRIEQRARGRYALPTASEARKAAAGLTAVVCLRSAAAHHGWELKTQPPKPEVMVRRGRKLSVETRVGLAVHWANLADDQVEHGVTTPLRTIVDCARILPFDEALAIADSALRSGAVTRADLDAIDVRGPVPTPYAACWHTPTSALPTRSSPCSAPSASRPDSPSSPRPRSTWARARCVPTSCATCSGSCSKPTRGPSTQPARPTGATVPATTCSSIRGWRVLRFTWEQVMHDQAYVRWVLAELARSVGRPEVTAARGRPRLNGRPAMSCGRPTRRAGASGQLERHLAGLRVGLHEHHRHLLAEREVGRSR